MSRENVEAIRRAYEAYNRGDLESMVVDIAPEFEYETTGAVPGTRSVYRGPEGWTEGKATSPTPGTLPDSSTSKALGDNWDHGDLGCQGLTADPLRWRNSEQWCRHVDCQVIGLAMEENG
jgi:hypothetical protein